MAAKYLVRLDDACATCSGKKWSLLENVLDKADIKPIVSIVAENKDPDLMYDEPDTAFWETVKQWRTKGWVPGLHGSNHILNKSKAGLVPINRYSEFCGLSLDVQKEKIKRAIDIWSSHEIVPDIWVAPAHSFDATTLIALRDVTTIRLVSDGLSPYPYVDKGFTWIPQQLWHFRKMPFGIWTICLHPNLMTEEQILQTGEVFLRNKDSFVTVNDVLPVKREKNIFDSLFSKVFENALQIKKMKQS